MEIIPILSALRRNKVGALLIGLQIALTLAIVCNSLSLIQQRLTRMHRPSGLDEANTFVFYNSYIGDVDNLPARVNGDLEALRSLPGVVDAVAANSFPLRDGGWSDGLKLSAEQKQPSAHTALYFADTHLMHTWDLRLVAGRWFNTDEIGQLHLNDNKVAPSMVITQSLAKQLFPSGNALGQQVYLDPKHPTRIVGIVERAQTPWAADKWGEGFIENSTFVPYQFEFFYLNFVVRTQPGMRDAVLKRVEDTLFAISGDRVIEKLSTFEEVRAHIYRSDRALNLILSSVCALLLTVTAFGIVGLTTYWVAQRRRQIGVRRALGARRVDILRYFQTENLLIAGAGALLGIALGLLGNMWLVTSLELTRMGSAYITLGALIVLLLSQGAVIWPALRAASVPPATATRAV